MNDAVAIVLASTVVESQNSADLSSSERFWTGIGRFLVTFLGSAGARKYPMIVRLCLTFTMALLLALLFNYIQN